jgi:hypothetical protein
MSVRTPSRPRAERPDASRPRRRVAPPAARRWRWAYPVVLAALAVATLVLSVAGAQLILDSRDGEVARAELDPTKPGYLASVAATPTLLVVHADDDGGFFGAAVLTLGADGAGGGVAVLPPEMFVQLEPETPVVGLEAIYEESGIEDLGTGGGLRSAVSTLLGADIDAVVKVDGSSLAPLIEPVAPLRYSLADPVRVTSGGKTVTLLPAGPVEIDTTDDIVAATQRLGSNEDPVRRAERLQRFWQAWIDAVSEAPDPAAAFPMGSADTEIARFVQGLAASNGRASLVPYVYFNGLLLPDTADLPGFIRPMIPFPRQEGVRTSVAVYNGVGDLELNKTVNRDLVAAGAQILSIGNTNSFGVDETTVAYHQPDARDRAEELADAIGVREVRFDEKEESDIEVTVTIGADYRP